MRINIYIKLLAFLIVAFAVTSCLDGDEMNTPPDGSKPFIMMTNNPSGGPLAYSGKRYFGNQALLLDPSVDNDTMTFAVVLGGVSKFNKDINVSLTTPAEALDDVNDGLVYEMLPAAGFDFINTSSVIAKGNNYAEFKVVLHPSKIDLSKNYMLPISASNDAGLVTSDNYGYLYYHIIGNPLAGVYRWSYRRYNRNDSTGALNGSVNDVALFAPKNPTTIETLGGYGATVGLNCPYVVTFTNTNGVLSDYKVTINPDLAGGLTDNGISLTTPPIIVKAEYTPTKKHFKFMFKVFNGTAYRTLIDEYWLP